MDFFDTCNYSNRLIEKLASLDHQNQLDFDLINNAIYWAKKYHDGQFRKSGEPFYTHPLEVAYIISDYNLTTNVIVASILHDIIEDTKVTAEMLIDNFGPRIAEIVDRLTRDRPDGTKITVDEILNNAYEKVDKEVILIKLADRLHNMQTISSMPPKNQIQTSTQTIDTLLFYSIYLNNLELEQKLTSLSAKILKRKYSNNSLVSEINESFNTNHLSTIFFSRDIK